MADVDGDPHPQALVDLGGDVTDALVDDFALTLVERAQRPLQVDFVGDDVRGASGLYASDREHALLVVERDEPRHELRGGRYGVFQLRAHGAVPARAAYREAQFVAGGHVFPGAESQRPDLQLRLDVLAHHGTHLVPVERVFGQHQRRTARVALLARLEQPEERAAEVGFGGELLQYPEEYRRVHVVAAGVHDAGGA